MVTLEQQLAQKQDEISRLRNKIKRNSDGQKIIIGGMMLSLALKDANHANELLSLINENITRDSDLKRLNSVITDLKTIANQSYQSQY